MEYRTLPHGSEKLSVLGLGMGCIQNAAPEEIEATVRKALDNGINFFDLCAGGAAVYAPFGRAMAGRREQAVFQLHFGAVYNEKGEYGWSRDREEIARTFRWELEQLQTDYADFGFLHCVDEMEDYEALVNGGVLEDIKALRGKGAVRRIGFSSHTPAVAQKLLDTGVMDLMMFSINPAYDYEKGDELGIGSVSERQALFRRCQKDGVGISVMKPFFGGKLLAAETSPFGQALTHYQCLQYVLDRPGVLSAVPGVRGLADLDQLLGFAGAGAEEKDYSVIGGFSGEGIGGSCVYCNHCQPCPAGIDVALVNKYYDLALAGDKLAVNHYTKLAKNAGDCLHCGHCDSRCPFGVKQGERMSEIAQWFARQK